MKSVVRQCRKFLLGPARKSINLRPARALVASLTLAPLLPGTGVVIADQVTIPLAENVRQSQARELPQRGESRASVESRFGEPQRRSGPVGQPPISQWHYEDFVVYFEHNHVVHTVVKK